jgi:hypothetical protein
METIAEQRREPTLADVAKHAGISTMTASRALRGKGVSEATKAAVEASAIALGYARGCKQCGGGGTSVIVKEHQRQSIEMHRFCSRICAAAFLSA